MENFDDARDAYKELKYGQPSASDLVNAADIIKDLVNRISDYDSDTRYWDCQ